LIGTSLQIKGSRSSKHAGPLRSRAYGLPRAEAQRSGSTLPGGMADIRAAARDARTEAGPRHLPDLRRAHGQKGVHDGVALGRHALEEAQAGFAGGGRPAGRVLCAAGGLSAAALMSAGLRPQPGAVLLYPGRTPVHTARAQALSGEARWPADSTGPVQHAPAPCKRQATRPEHRLHRW